MASLLQVRAFCLLLLVYIPDFVISRNLPNDSGEMVLVTGATGRTGALVYAHDDHFAPVEPKQGYKELKKRGTVGVRALVRNAEKARALLGCGECGEDEGVFVGDVTKPGTLTAAMEGVTRIVILSASVPLKAENGTYYFPPGGSPKEVDYIGSINQVVAATSAGVKQVLLVSSMGTTEPDSFLDKLAGGHSLFFKLNAEAVVMSSNIPFTVVKPSGLLDEGIPAGDRELVVGHGDHFLEKQLSSIPRADVANVIVHAIEMPSVSTNLRFDLSSNPAKPATGDFKQLFNDARDLSGAGMSSNSEVAVE